MPGRGRGRGRGRGGRGGGRGGRRGPPRDNVGDDDQQKDAPVISIKDDPLPFFTGTATAQQHYEAQNEDCGRYCSAFTVLAKNGIKIAQNAKIRALAVALGRNDKLLVSAFLQTRSQFGLVEVLKAITLLDAGRQVRVHEKRLKSLELSKTRVRPHKLAKLRVEINNLKKMQMPAGSASGAVCKIIARWVQGFTKEELEFYAIHFPKEPWKKLADICHFKPKDFPTALWFLPHCFDSGELPDDSIVKACLGLDENTINQLVSEREIPFSVLKKFQSALTDDSKKRIAIYEPKLDTVLWNYEDLRSPKVNEVIYQRLSRGDTITLSNGKLLERLLTITLQMSKDDAKFLEEQEGLDNFFTRLIEVADPRLTSIRLPLESPVAILGDASPSMSVAIRTSTIIASLLTSICSAKLVFFDSVNRDAPFQPKTVTEMLKLAMKIKTTGATSPAASLYPFYKRKEIVKTFIVVTDEEENREFEGYMFHPLFKKYHDEVYPATLVFISFLHSQHAKGQMVTKLQHEGFNPKQLVMNRDRPDLSKLDDLFGQLSVTTGSFQDQLVATEEEYRANGVVKLLKGITGADQMYADAE